MLYRVKDASHHRHYTWGVDLGTSNVAFAGIDSVTKEYRVEIIRFEPDLDPYEIHKRIQDQMDILGIDPGDHFFIESAFFGRNQRTFSRMTRVAHSVYIIASGKGAFVDYLDNNKWRSVIFGTSRVKKEEAQKWAMEKWSLEGWRSKDAGHLCDALCVAHAGDLIKDGDVVEDRKHIRRGSKRSGGSKGMP